MENITRSDISLFKNEESQKCGCHNCGWEGTESELHIGLDEDFENVNVCPECETDMYLYDIE